jgi:hypothetical protein
MAVIGQALGELTDPAARQRVLRWAQERFAVEAVSDSVSAIAGTPAAAANADLGVDGLNEMFTASVESEDDSLLLEPRPAVLAQAEKTSLETTIRSFAADFQRFADEWNGAAA